MLCDYLPSEYRSTEPDKHAAYYDLFVRRQYEHTLDDLVEYIRKYLTPTQEMKQIPQHYSSFIVNVFTYNYLIQVNLRNRRVINEDLFILIVESHFSHFYIKGTIQPIVNAINSGISPVFIFNMVYPYFMRIVNMIVHGQVIQQQAVFSPAPTTKYYLSYTTLEARWRMCIKEDWFARSFAFIMKEPFDKAFDDIFGAFTDLSLEQTDRDSLRNKLYTAIMERADEERQVVRRRCEIYKKELVEYVYSPRRVWRVSQKLGINAWEYLDGHA